MIKSIRLCAALVVALVAVGGMTAHADILPLAFTATVDGVTTVYGLNGDLDGDIFAGQGEIVGSGFELGWAVSGDLDPVLDFALSVTDFGAPSAFSFSFFMPVPALVGPFGTAGSISGSITDTNGDGASIASEGGNPVYTASINGTQFQTLMNDPFSFSSGVPFASTPIPAQSFGVPGLSVPGPNVVLNSMAIDIHFTTSGGGDVAALTGNFVVEPIVVPEPASMTLLGLGLAGVVIRRFRRNVTRA